MVMIPRPILTRRSSLLKLAVLGFGFVAILSYHSALPEKNQPAVKSVISPDEQSHQVFFYDDWRFFQATKNVERKIYDSKQKVAGGIVPHHLLASDMIADFFKRLSIQKPDTIILLGPNHPEAGNFKALSSLHDWQTPFGLLKSRRGAVNTFLDRNLVKIDEDVLAQEHSVAGIMPFIKYYLPDATVVPVIISGTMDSREAEMLAEALNGTMTENTVIVSSVDFSHYLPADQAAKNDELTLDLIKQFDYQSIFRLGNGYLDSPPSIAILLMSMEKINASKVELLQHANSADFLENQEGKGITSYFSLIFE